MSGAEREVYCLLGLPFDAVDMAQAEDRIRRSVSDRQPCFLSTPNLNFLIACQSDAAFRDSVIHSDLSVADGMPLIWMSRLLGIPLPERVAGSGLFERLWRGPGAKSGTAFPVYFFGGPDGVAERACRTINDSGYDMVCVGAESPGFGSVQDMSGEDVLARINGSGVGFVVVALGARKGQAWIELNRARIAAPVISHLGAVVNFVAGTVSRAPIWMQRTGLEWLWRIKEEPGLWKRYWQDGLAFGRLFFGRVLPYALWLRGHRGLADSGTARLEDDAGQGVCRIAVCGDIPGRVGEPVRTVLREAAARGQDVVLDLSAAGLVSPAFFGGVLLLRKALDAQGRVLRVQGVSLDLRKQFVWNGVEYLL